ncbi:MAG: helix-turn-helix domain-containing protein [Nostocoides sp.]
MRVESRVVDAVGETSQALERGIQLIELLARPEHAHGLTITELARELGIGRPMVYRLVATWRGHDGVRRDPGGRVRLGVGLVRLGKAVAPVISELAHPVLRTLADTVLATAHLTVVDRGEVVPVVVVAPTTTTVHVAYRTGGRHPLTVGAAGQAILAGRRGSTEVVCSNGELNSSAFGMAIPVMTGPIEASVGVLSLGPLELCHVQRPLRAAARDLGEVLKGSIDDKAPRVE